jgi:hypothetical protein
MTVDIEQTLSRELQQVAEGLRVPPLPRLPREPRRPSRHRAPLAAAAAVVVIAGIVAFALGHRDDRDVQPAPSPSSPTATTTRAVSTSEPSVPYVVDRTLHVGGHTLPGTWWSVGSGPHGWVGLRTDGTWWWAPGTQTDPQRVELSVDEPPVLSPSGRYVGELSTDQGGSLTGFDTRPGGEGLGGVALDLGDRQQGTAVTVRAVLDDGRVVAQGTRTAVLWLPLDDNRTVDLTRTAPGQVVLADTPAGLVVTDGEDGPAYLADLGDDGTLTRLADLPQHDDLAVSPDGSGLMWTPLGTTRGDVTTVATLQAREVSGTDATTVTAPQGYSFALRAWAWEDADHLVARVVDASGGERMARCALPGGRCVVVRTP